MLQEKVARSVIIATMKWIALLLVVFPLALLIAGKLGLLLGKAPTYLGVNEGKLARPALGKWNSVASQYPASATDYFAIEPIRYQGDDTAAMQRLNKALEQTTGCRIVSHEANYLYAQCETRWLRFVDDVEFLLVPEEKAIHVRSASRLGRKDFGVNRARIEHLRLKVTTP